MDILRKIPDEVIPKGGEYKFFTRYKGVLCPHVILTQDEIRNYSGRLLVIKDLKWALEITTSAIKLLSNEDESFNWTLVAEGLFRSAIMTYTKCFKTDNRGASLDPSMFKNNEEMRNIYLEIKNFRDSYLAHAGGSKLEDCEFRLVLNPKNMPRGILNIQPIIRDTNVFSKINGEGLLSILEFSIDYMSQKQMGKYQALKKKMESIPIEDLYGRAEFPPTKT
jgi:hypothetical protein